MWPFTIIPTITSVESVESLVNEDGNCLINLLQEKPLIAVTVNSLFNGYLWDRNEVSVLVCCPSYRESNKGVMRGRDQLKGVRHIKVSAKRESSVVLRYTQQFFWPNGDCFVVLVVAVLSVGAHITKGCWPAVIMRALLRYGMHSLDQKQDLFRYLVCLI